MSRFQVSCTIKKTDTYPVCLYTSTYMVYILYPIRNPNSPHYSCSITFINFGHALVVVLLTGWARFWCPFFKCVNVFQLFEQLFTSNSFIVKIYLIFGYPFCAHFLYWKVTQNGRTHQSLEMTHGLDFKTPIFPAMLYIAVTVLTRRIYI